MTTLHIKNMVCDRCKKVIKDELTHLGVEVVSVELGAVKVNGTPDLAPIREVLSTNGFELVDDPEDVLVERVKVILIERVNKFPEKTGKLSSIISDGIGKDYSHVSKLFSRKQQTTIEKYFLALKLERVKEMIQAGDKTFSEIAYELDYSGVNHLSAQFKSATGMSMSEYRKLGTNRKSLDQVS